MKRSEVLAAADRLVHGDRNRDYGDPTQNHDNIGMIWGAILNLGEPIPAPVVAAMMAGVKLARIGHTPLHEDSWVDLAGYAAVGGEAAEKYVGR